MSGLDLISGSWVDLRVSKVVDGGYFADGKKGAAPL